MRGIAGSGIGAGREAVVAGMGMKRGRKAGGGWGRFAWGLRGIAWWKFLMGHGPIRELRLRDEERRK